MDALNHAAVAAAEPEALDCFGATHFGDCDLGDLRLDRRAVLAADALFKHPQGTLPAKLPADQLLRYYHLANHPKVTHDKLLAPHCAHTRRQAQAGAADGAVILIVHDTTEADFSGLSVEGLGPIGNGGCRGLLLHNVLAIRYEAGQTEVLGLLAQLIHCRRKVSRRESKTARRDHPQRESRLWPRGVAAVGAVPEGQVWVNLMDRGGDTFECLEAQVRQGQHFAVRSSSNRRVRVRNPAGRWRTVKLHNYLRTRPDLGRRTVAVAANLHQPARTATVRVAAAAVEVQAPRQKRGEHSSQPLNLWCMHVKEIDPPAGATALEWFVLSDLSTDTWEQATRRIDWYECRPGVEEFHKAQKTGCDMEQVQFTRRKALEVHIAMMSVVAVGLLRLRDLSRGPEADRRRADTVIDREYVQVLSLWRLKQQRADWSVKEFLHALARLGGHLGRRHDKPPGWLVLWRGWMTLQSLVDGARLQRLKRRR